MIEKLENNAIEFALKGDWASAINMNLEIIKLDKENIPALNRLAKAYIENNNSTKAKQIFETVLKLDPHNKVARKNIQNTKSKKTINIDSSNLIKEPGTSAYTDIKITGKVKSKEFSKGQILIIKLTQKGSIYDQNENFVGYLGQDLTSKILNNQITENDLTISVNATKRGVLKLLIKCSKPIFSSEKKDIIPYFSEEELIEDKLDMTVTEEQGDIKGKEAVAGMIEGDEDEHDNEDDDDNREHDIDDEEDENEEE